MTKKSTKTESVVIQAPDFGKIAIPIIGTAPLCINRFGSIQRRKIQEAHEAGSQSKSRKNREPKDFDALFKDAAHISEEGWYGIHAAAFRNAAISACKVVGFHMTRAKLSIFTIADGLGREDATPLVKIIGGEPEMSIDPVRNDSGVVDLRARPVWRRWGAIVKIRWDRGQFSETDVYNLMMRVGLQVGVGEGRPDSKDSAGLGYGLFDLAENIETFNDFARKVAA